MTEVLASLAAVAVVVVLGWLFVRAVRGGFRAGGRAFGRSRTLARLAHAASTRGRDRRARFIREYAFHPSVDQKLAEAHPDLTPTQRARVLEGLRDWFIVCLNRPARTFVTMPSRLVDDAWELAGSGPGYSWPNGVFHLPPLRLDHLTLRLIREGLRRPGLLGEELRPGPNRLVLPGAQLGPLLHMRSVAGLGGLLRLCPDLLGLPLELLNRPEQAGVRSDQLGG